MAENTRLKELQEGQRRLEADNLKHNEAELKLREQITSKANMQERMMISTRFEDLREDNIVVEFNKLRHTGSYSDYVEKFEELRECMQLFDNKVYSENYFIASFLSGLSEELRSAVKMFNPSTLDQAVKTSAQPLTSVPTPTQKNPVKFLTSAQMSERRSQGLCYNCDERYTPGHRCKARINYIIMIEEEEELSYIESKRATEEVADMEFPTDEVLVSLNAIKGDTSITTLKFTGYFQGHQLHILLDTCTNGQRLTSLSQTGRFEWDLQGHNLQHSLRLLQLEGCDIILGGDWLKDCSPIELDYEKMTVAIHYQGKKVKLLANSSVVDCQMISHHTLYKMLHTKARHDMEEIYVVSISQPNHKENQKLQGLLDEYAIIFQEPDGL
ncbi:hypothetical protein C2S51_009784 [Perilla frutescens var. frutescens]|nr:hypothetical protein C2S51_009784 [Perilla frutescens var. frutescens]